MGDNCIKTCFNGFHPTTVPPDFACPPLCHSTALLLHQMLRKVDKQQVGSRAGLTKPKPRNTDPSGMDSWLRYKRGDGIVLDIIPESMYAVLVSVTDQIFEEERFRRS